MRDIIQDHIVLHNISGPGDPTVCRQQARYMNVLTREDPRVLVGPGLTDVGLDFGSALAARGVLVLLASTSMVSSWAEGLQSGRWEICCLSRNKSCIDV